MCVRVYVYVHVQSGNARWAYDTYRRFLQMFSIVVGGSPHDTHSPQLSPQLRSG